MCHKAILNILFCFKVYAKVNCSGGDSRGTACPASYGRYENIVLSQLELNRLKAAGSVAANNIENVFSKTQEIRCLYTRRRKGSLTPVHTFLALSEYIPCYKLIKQKYLCRFKPAMLPALPEFQLGKNPKCLEYEMPSNRHLVQ